MKAPVVDYRKFSFSKLNTQEFEHLKYLAFWPVFGLLFLTVERLWIRDAYYPMHCALDDAIPFCEFFVIPYLLWFAFLIGIHLYTLLFDPESFKRLMKFIMVSYSLAIVVYIVFPNCQTLRPIKFERDNIFTRFMADFYQFDTNTNVCPSIHVIGSAAVFFCVWDCERLRAAGWRLSFGAAALLISVSTVFLKQHSLLDILAAIPVCAISHHAAYGRENKKYWAGLAKKKKRPLKNNSD